MNCLFCKIVQGDIKANVVHEDQEIIAFRDIKPQAPFHLLVIPKRHIATINDINDEDATLVGSMILCAKKLAQKEGLRDSGYRLVFNINAHGGQEIYHIHLHVLGGRQMSWPPG